MQKVLDLHKTQYLGAFEVADYIPKIFQLNCFVQFLDFLKFFLSICFGKYFFSANYFKFFKKVYLGRLHYFLLLNVLKLPI